MTRRATSSDSWVLLKGRVRTAPASLPDDFDLVAKRRDLVVLRWRMDFEDLDDLEEASELLWTKLGPVLEWHTDRTGVLVLPARAAELPATWTYAEAVAVLRPAGRWLANLAAEPGGRLVAAERSDIPLPAMKGAKLGELHVVPRGRAVRELGLGFEPLRVTRLELFVDATPRAVADFYSPLLKARGFKVKRRVWSDGSAEQLLAAAETLEAVIHAAAQDGLATFVRITWIEKA